MNFCIASPASIAIWSALHVHYGGCSIGDSARVAPHTRFLNLECLVQKLMLSGSALIIHGQVLCLLTLGIPFLCPPPPKIPIWIMHLDEHKVVSLLVLCVFLVPTEPGEPLFKFNCTESNVNTIKKQFKKLLHESNHESFCDRVLVKTTNYEFETPIVLQYTSEIYTII